MSKFVYIFLFVAKILRVVQRDFTSKNLLLLITILQCNKQYFTGERTTQNKMMMIQECLHVKPVLCIKHIITTY